MQLLTDEELIARYRLAPASPEARRLLDELFRRLQKRVALWCYRLTSDRDRAADLTQEVLMRVFRNLASFRGDSKFSTWVYTIARNHCFNEFRTRAPEPVSLEEELVEPAAGGDQDPHTLLERESTARSLARLLQDALTEPEIQVMTLHFGEELPLETITRLLGLRNPSGAKAYVVSAKRKLRVAVQRWKARARQERP